MNNMSEFQEFFTDKSFISSYSAFLSGDIEDKEKGIIYVEDASDWCFWEHFVAHSYPNQYICRASSKNGKNVAGKRFLENLYTQANDKAIVAVDSDYDYIASKRQASHAFNHNKYIIHTHSFSRESVEIEKNRIQLFFSKCRLTIPNNINLLEFINIFSELCFKGLARYTILLDNSQFSTIHNKKFHSCFNILSKRLVNENLFIDHSSLDDIERNIDLFFSDKNLSNEDIKNTEIFLRSIGISNENAYRFISGHILYDLIKKIHRETLEQLMKAEVNSAKKNVQSKEIKTRLKQIAKHFNSSFSIETHCNSINIDPNDEIHKHIVTSIEKIKN